MSHHLHLVHVLTSSLAARRMYPDYGRMWRADGVRVTLISSPGPDLDRFGQEEGVATVGIPIEREVAPLRDLVSLYRLWRELSRLQPDLIECGTPKAGLLGGIAGLLAGVPTRVYTLHGLRLETARGWRRAVLRLTERLSVRIASETIAVSRGLLRRARALGVVPVDQGTVAGPGSAGGIDASRFAEVARSQSKGNTIGFVGRLTRDKGIVELVDAFVQLKKNRPNAGLLLVGDFESGDPLPARTRQLIRSDLSIRRTGFVDDATPFYAAIDVVALPSYREGFPLVALGAAAAARPIVAANCTGMSDAVLDGRTGVLVPVGDSQRLAAALGDLLDDSQCATRMGRRARGRVIREFQPGLIWSEKQLIYRRLLAESALRRLPIQRLVKRAADMVLSGALLLLLIPLIALVAVIVAVIHGQPVLFRQDRPGLLQRSIRVLKFRTMSNECTADGSLLSDEHRVTPLGKLLRRWSLDELPQLWSVLRGEMSLVGPRPLLREYLDRYSSRQKTRFLVKPGITGWAQVNGRNSVDWEERLEMDVWYAENWTLGLDVHILLRTIVIVLTGRGVEAQESSTPPPYLGALQHRL